MNASVRLLCFCRSSVLVSVKVSVKASVKVSVKKTHKNTQKRQKHTKEPFYAQIHLARSDGHRARFNRRKIINLKIFHEIGSKSTISRRAAKKTTFYMLKDRLK